MSQGASDGERLRLEVSGAVQGVGFRPAVYRLATGLGLAGWVLNDSGGVEIEVEGARPVLERFVSELRDAPPPRARITGIRERWLEPVGFDRFEIRHSDGAAPPTVLILPDLATCEPCRAEVLDPADRRHRYPFTNCTDCGPRLSIIEALPYDRPATTMAGFEMCPSCLREYTDPLDRRFHAQPNACPRCGPALALWDAEGSPVAAGDEALERAAARLRGGEIVAVKGLGGFHLVVVAANAEAVGRLRDRKRRPTKPLAVMCRDLAQARSLARIDDAAGAALAGVEAPILLLPRRAGAALADGVAPDTSTVGVMLAYTPLHHLLLDAVGAPIVATSGNLSDEPICTDEREAVARLAGVADAFLVHDRPIARPVDDSVAWLVGGAPRLLRRARGYAPLPLAARRSLPPILAVGAHLKATVALSSGDQVIVSQHIGDLGTVEAQEAFERAATDLLALYRGDPAAVAHDLHPDYASTRWAERCGLPRIAVQHHHAHLAACLLDAGVDGPALGVTWDGTGYGPDGTVWGGELLLGDARGYERVASLRPFRLPGGDAAVREPRRTALALASQLDGAAGACLDGLFTPRERQVFERMIDRGIRAPVTTSAGRLFDGVAALAGLYGRVSYEGQAAIALETLAEGGAGPAYPLPLVDGEGGAPRWLDWRPLLDAVARDLARGVRRADVAARFHQALADGIVRVAREVGCARVALSGGCFQNRRLTELAAAGLAAAGFEVLLHRELPPNDGGISAGQIAVAAAQLQDGAAG